MYLIHTTWQNTRAQQLSSLLSMFALKMGGQVTLPLSAGNSLYIASQVKYWNFKYALWGFFFLSEA